MPVSLPQRLDGARKVLRSVRRSVREIIVNSDIDPLPIRKTIRNYDRTKAKADLSSGFEIALLTIPQSMAYATVAGLPITWGLFGAIIASIVGAIFARSRFVQFGPTNATAVLVLASFLSMGIDPDEAIGVMPTVLLLSGLFLAVGAWFRAAGIIQYVSRSVITGYITAAAFFIIVNQTRPALGLDFDLPKEIAFIELCVLTLRSLPGAHPPTVLLTFATVAVYLYLKGRGGKVPVVALTLVFGGFAGQGINALLPPLEQAIDPALVPWLGGPIQMLGSVSFGSLSFGFPSLAPDMVSQLTSLALVLAFLSVLEGASIGKSLAAKAGERLHTDQEMFALGVANVANSFTSGMPASGSLTRSALAYATGARTPLASLFCGLFVLAALLLVGPFVRFLPTAVLAVVVIFIGLSLFNRRHIRIVTRSTKGDAIVFVTTCAAALLVRLDVAIVVGTAISMFLFIRNVSRPELVEYSFNPEGMLTEMEGEARRNDPEISIVHVEGEIFFGAAELFRDQIRRVFEDENLKVVVLKMRNAYHLDATSVMALEELVRYMKERDRLLLVSEARKDVIRIFKKSGLLEVIGRDNVFPDVTQNPTMSTARALRRAQKLLGKREARITIFADAGSGTSGEVNAGSRA